MIHKRTKKQKDSFVRSKIPLIRREFQPWIRLKPKRKKTNTNTDLDYYATKFSEVYYPIVKQHYGLDLTEKEFRTAIRKMAGIGFKRILHFVYREGGEFYVLNMFRWAIFKETLIYRKFTQYMLKYFETKKNKNKS